MKHYCPSVNVESVDLDIVFANPVERMPPQRGFHNIQVEDVGFWEGGYTFRLARIGMDVLRENFSAYRRDLPPFQGRMDLLEYWIESIGEALFNPIWMRWVRDVDFLEHPNPKKRGRIPNIKYQLLHGHHRIRMLDALDPNHIWVYMVTGHHHGRDRSSELRRVLKLNDRVPLRGTRTAICSQCGTQCRVSSRKFNEFNIKRWYTCKACGHFDDTYQPYPERL